MGTGKSVFKVVMMVLIGTIFVVLANLWVRQGALITLASQVAMSVPPVPALTALVIMLAGLVGLRKLGIQRREVMAIYCFLTLAIALTSGAAMRFFLPSLTSAQYFASPENDFDLFMNDIPTWMVPHGDTVIRDYFEGSLDGSTPWGAWLQPLTIWMGYFLMFFTLLTGLAMLFQPVWEEGEHLTFPIAEVPLMLAGYRDDAKHVWRDSLFWIGVLLVCVHHLLNILNAFNPSVTCLGMETDLGGLLQDWPMSSIRPLVFRYRPFVFGVAYLMPTEIAVSTVVFYFGWIKALALGGAMSGVNMAGFPFQMEQAAGSFLGMGLILVFAARERIVEVFGRLTGQSKGSKLLPASIIISGLAIYLFWRAAGMGTGLFVMYYGLMLAFALASTRLRAEGGYANNWIRPLEQEQQVLVNFFGTNRLRSMSGMGGLTAMTISYYMTRGYMPQLMAFISESFKIGGQTKIDRRQMAAWVLAAVLIGSAVSWWMHISTGYQFGSNILEGGSTQGGARVGLMRGAYMNLASWATVGEGPDHNRSWATLTGFILVLGVAALRRAFLRFPLHPIGLLMAYTGGGENTWGPLLVMVIIKTVVMRIGGMKLYRRLIPLFLGIAIGHFFAAGLVWSLIASFGGEGFNKYPVWF